jgi:uncharacterized protein involved in exopolysaccharide biosynthesis
MSSQFIFALCILIIGLALCLTGLGLLISPTRYQAIEKIKIEPDVVTDASGDVYQPYDPYFMAAEPKRISSDIVLSNVVQSLNLDEKWGQRYGNGRTISTKEAIERLRRMMVMKLLTNTSLIEIRVTDGDPAEAAQIADAVAIAYRDFRIDRYKQDMSGGIKMLEEDYQTEEAKIQTMQAQLEQREKQFDATNSNSSLKLANDVSYVNSKQNLHDAEEFHQLSRDKIESAKAEGTLPKWSLVTIIEPATPPKTPVGPGRLFGAVLFIGGMAMSGFGIYLLRGRKISATPSNRI